MRLLISTPAALGLVTVPYIQSLIPALAWLRDEGHSVDLHMLGSESLINRARNTAATYAVTKGYDKILFIDADMVFSVEGLKRLIESDKEIIGGSYPLKAYPITINFNPLEEHRDLYGESRKTEDYQAWVKKYADERGEAEVLHVPTGFLLVDCKVLAALTYKVPWYQNYSPDTGEREVFYDFFPTRVRDNQLCSEDWGFMETARENGFKVYLQTKVINGHIGNHHFALGNREIIFGQPPVIG